MNSSELKRSGLCAITGAIKPAPTVAIEILLNIPPQHFHVDAVVLSSICIMHVNGSEVNKAA